MLNYNDMEFILNFQDPATTFCYHLIGLHHDVCWFILIILALVYWSLFKILDDFSWYVSSKKRGLFSKISHSFLFYSIQFYYLFIYFGLMKLSCNICLELYELFDYSNDMIEDITDQAIILLKFVNILNLQNWTVLNDLLEDYYLNSTLFNMSNNVKCFYFKKVSSFYLPILSFRDSIALEWIFACLPSTIIGLIIVPSLFLLYSLDEAINPQINLKVIGHHGFGHMNLVILVKIHLVLLLNLESKISLVFWLMNRN